MKFIESNFEENFVEIFEARAQGIIKRLWEGGEPGYLPGKKNDLNKAMMEQKKSQGGLAYEMEKMKILSAHEIKHDIEFLN